MRVNCERRLPSALSRSGYGASKTASVVTQKVVALATRTIHALCGSDEPNTKRRHSDS